MLIYIGHKLEKSINQYFIKQQEAFLALVLSTCEWIIVIINGYLFCYYLMIFFYLKNNEAFPSN